MTEPITINCGFTVANTGDLPGAWGTSALNPDFVAIDGLFGGLATVALSSGTTTMTAPTSGVITPGAGPNQTQNAILYLSGTLSADCTLVFGTPGRWVVRNNCVNANTRAIAMQASGFTGAATRIGAPPSQAVIVYSDGVSMDYANMPPAGSLLATPGLITYAPWMTACTVLPYLACNGASYLVATYPQLSTLLGYRYGGSGLNFNVPTIAADSGGGITFIKT